MKLVIEIPDEYRKIFETEKCKSKFDSLASNEFGYVLRKAFENGTPLPKGHGELKDINALRQKLMIWDYKVNAIPNYAWKCIEDTPTIIEADNGGVEDEVSD